MRIKNFGSSLILDFRISWRHVQAKNNCLLSHAGQNYWMLIGWDRGHFSLTKRALLVIKRAWLLDADWLSMTSLNWFPASNGVWKRNFRNVSLLSLMLTRSFHFNLKENQHATKAQFFGGKAKGFSRPKTYWFPTWKQFEWGGLVLNEALDRTLWPPNWKLISSFCYESRH